MPGGNGFDTLVELRKGPETANIPIIIVSIVDQRQVGFALGAADYLIKPIRKPTLLETIRKHVPPAADDDEATILLVDDVPETLELLEETLRPAGYETQSVQNGLRALEVLSSKIVNAVLLDLMMPGMDGFEVIRHVRKEPTLRDLPIFVMTGKTLAQEEIALLSQETQALFHKNGSWRQQLAVEVDRVVRRRQLEALRMIEQEPPDMLLLDIGMPGLDGFAVVRAIREKPNLFALPVLAVTAYAMQGDRERVLKAGFDGYLSKPINAKALAQELERLLSWRDDGRAATQPREIEANTAKPAAKSVDSEGH
jgi:CheY-like chemotaxis protein